MRYHDTDTAVTISTPVPGQDCWHPGTSLQVTPQHCNVSTQHTITDCVSIVVTYHATHSRNNRFPHHCLSFQDYLLCITPTNILLFCLPLNEYYSDGPTFYSLQYSMNILAVHYEDVRTTVRDHCIVYNMVTQIFASPWRESHPGIGMMLF